MERIWLEISNVAGMVGTPALLSSGLLPVLYPANPFDPLPGCGSFAVAHPLIKLNTILPKMPVEALDHKVHYK
jgi:hypothetical protein